MRKTLRHSPGVWLRAGILGWVMLLGTSLGNSALAQPVPPVQCVTNAIAGGTVNAITIPLLPCGFATNLLLLTVQGTNTSAGPTIQMTGFPAQPLVSATGAVLGVGALPGAGGVVLVSPTGTKWLLIAGGGGGTSAQALSITTVTSSAYNVLVSDQLVLVKRSPAGATSIVLPAGANWPLCPSSPQACPTIGVKDGAGNFSAGMGTVTTADGKTIDGLAAALMPFNYQEQDFVYNGTEWSLK